MNKQVISFNEFIRDKNSFYAYCDPDFTMQSIRAILSCVTTALSVDPDREIVIVPNYLRKALVVISSLRAEDNICELLRDAGWDVDFSDGNYIVHTKRR